MTSKEHIWLWSVYTQKKKFSNFYKKKKADKRRRPSQSILEKFKGPSHYAGKLKNVKEMKATTWENLELRLKELKFAEKFITEEEGFEKIMVYLDEKCTYQG